jgi:AcrR family transcriptional regulator
MVDRQGVLHAAVVLTLEQGTAPSIAEVARAVGLTKQGVLHYFPSRAALDEAVLLTAVGRVDAEITAAAQNGRAAETYLRLAAPSDEDRAAALVMVTLLRRGDPTLLPRVEEAVTKWQSMIAQELGDPVRARVVRLVGDGLFSESLITGKPPSVDLLDELVAHLIRGAPASRS